MTQKSFKNSKARILLETKSLPATFLNIDSIHDTCFSLTLLLNIVKDNEHVRANVQQLVISKLNKIFMFNIEIFNKKQQLKETRRNEP